MKDSLGDRMKLYENIETSRVLMPLAPIMLRFDGVAFHTFTKGLKRPYDERLSYMMVETTKFLAKTVNAVIGYTQSDEITLICYSENYDTQLYFGGKIFKLQSVLASKASVYFNSLLHNIPEKMGTQPVFDCRVWNLPSKEEAVNALIWREQDATRNSISMAAQSMYSQKELHGKSKNEMQELMHQKGVNWNNYPTFFKRGTYVRKQLNEKNRSVWNSIEIPVLTTIVNRTGVVFDNAIPTTKQQQEKIDNLLKQALGENNG